MKFDDWFDKWMEFWLGLWMAILIPAASVFLLILFWMLIKEIPGFSK